MMTLRETLSAFLCGAAAIVIAHVAVTIDVGAQPATDALDVCVTSANTMRLTGPDGTCGAGERKMRLKPPGVERPCEEARRPDLEALQRRIATLEGRADERLLDRTAIAPFEVVNGAGIAVFTVRGPSPTDSVAGTDIADETGFRMVTIAANTEGGAVTVGSGVKQTYQSEGGPLDLSVARASLSAHGEYAGLDVWGRSDRVLELGRRPTGRYGLSVLGRAGKVIAGIGESAAGSGIAMVYDADGNPRASINFQSQAGSGIARVIDAAGQVVAALSSAGVGGSGLLQLFNNAETVMVEAGVLNTGIGVVRAGPGAFQHGIGFVGLPASYIEGSK